MPGTSVPLADLTQNPKAGGVVTAVADMRTSKREMWGAKIINPILPHRILLECLNPCGRDDRPTGDNKVVRHASIGGASFATGIAWAIVRSHPVLLLEENKQLRNGARDTEL